MFKQGLPIGLLIGLVIFTLICLMQLVCNAEEYPYNPPETQSPTLACPWDMYVARHDEGAAKVPPGNIRESNGTITGTFTVDAVSTHLVGVYVVDARTGKHLPIHMFAKPYYTEEGTRLKVTYRLTGCATGQCPLK